MWCWGECPGRKCSVVGSRNQGLTQRTLLVATTGGLLPEDSKYLEYPNIWLSHFAQPEEFKDGTSNCNSPSKFDLMPSIRTLLSHSCYNAFAYDFLCFIKHWIVTRESKHRNSCQKWEAKIIYRLLIWSVCCTILWNFWVIKRNFKPPQTTQSAGGCWSIIDFMAFMF